MCSILCYDSISRRYFKSSTDLLEKATNEVNMQILRDGYISLNVLYDEIGLSTTDLGKALGWNLVDGLVELRFDSQLTRDGIPCLVIGYVGVPKYDYCE